MSSLKPWHRKLGNTGISVSPIGLGTVKLGRNSGVKYPDSFSIPNDQEASNLLAQAAELGINLLDTAPAYGNSEERLGKLLSGQRERWIICSKAGEEFDPATGESHYDFSADFIRRSVERSLQRLKTDCIDLLLIHSNGNDLDIIHKNAALETLNALKKEGKIRATGMSTKTVEGGILAADFSDCVMATWNLDYDAELPVIDYCQRINKGVLIKKALASGHLQHKNSEDPVTDALRMMLSHEGVSSIILGTINPAHLQTNVATSIKVLA